MAKQPTQLNYVENSTWLKYTGKKNQDFFGAVTRKRYNVNGKEPLILVDDRDVGQLLNLERKLFLTVVLQEEKHQVKAQKLAKIQASKPEEKKVLDLNTLTTDSGAGSFNGTEGLVEASTEEILASKPTSKKKNV